MRKMNDYAFVAALFERSDIIVADRGMEADVIADAALIESVEADMLRERMLGLAERMLEEIAHGTVH